MKKCRDNRIGGLPRPYTHVCEFATEVECIKFYGIFEGHKSTLIIFERHGMEIECSDVEDIT